MEHEDPEKQYEVKLPYGSYIEFSKYVDLVHSKGLDIPDVMTKITRIENPKGQGGLFTFEMGDSVADSVGEEEEDPESEPEEVELTDAESKALADIVAKAAAMGEGIDVEFAAKMLTKTKTLKGITMERALAIVNTVAVDGMIG